MIQNKSDNGGNKLNDELQLQVQELYFWKS